VEQYDVLVIGSDIESLVSALFLARKMRSVSVIIDGKENPDGDSEVEITDPENNKYRFAYDSGAFVSGLNQNGLLEKYLHAIGIDTDLTGEVSEYDMVETTEGEFRKRINIFERFLVYLVRYYPKQRDEIHRFFRDLEKHYENYVMQQEYMLKNTDYTLTSLMIEWGDYSLSALLGKYFSDPLITNEFMMNCQLNGLNSDDVSSYNFFSGYFLGLKEGFYYLPVSVDGIKKLLMEKLKIINPKIIQHRRIKEYVGDVTGRITHVIDSTNKEIAAKHIIVGSKPDRFYKKYFPDLTEHLELIDKFHPGLESPTRIRTVYLALNQKPHNIGITEMNYCFSCAGLAKPYITRLFNYSLYEPTSTGAKKGALCVDYVYDENTEIGEQEILAQIYSKFPKLKKTIVGIKQGNPRELSAMVSLDEVRRGLTINEEIAIEASEHLMFFDNLHLTGSWVRPEAGLFGRFHTGVVLGDKIEESLYYGENDDSFYYLTNDEIMVMLKHNYGRKTLGKLENHINFQIGKSSYYVRIKDKNLTIHRGEYPHPDLTIYTTNDKLSNLLLKKVCFENVMESGGLKYTGSSELLYKVVDAFELDDCKKTEVKFQPKLPVKNAGAKLMFVYLLAFSALAFLCNFIDMIWLVPFALGISLAMGYLKWRFFRRISWFEFSWAGIYLAMLFMAIFWQPFNVLHNDDMLLGLMGGMFFISWIINQPIVHDFRKYDYRADYAETKFFKTVNNGMTFVWALIFLLILGGVHVSGDRYVSAWYNLVFLGIFLTYYYPIIYVSTNIKK